ncbi:uncharacterized protein VTP21DRAFT_6213 [Calcarisporiella thermophila]|uniref:uncharacterized protein n=1 Tax=Calcarisporiella thermophila TaxID=911321 RepID=UPI0037424BE1
MVDKAVSNMDRLTQLQNSIDQLARQFIASISYLHDKSSLVQLNPSIPVDSSAGTNPDPSEVFNQNTRELATDICKKAKEIDALIEALPGIDRTEADQIKMLEEVEAQNVEANREHRKAVERAESLLNQVTTALRAIADDQSKSSQQGFV